MIVHTKGLLNFWSVKKAVSLTQATLMRKKKGKRKIQLSLWQSMFPFLCVLCAWLSTIHMLLGTLSMQALLWVSSFDKCSGDSNSHPYIYMASNLLRIFGSMRIFCLSFISSLKIVKIGFFVFMSTCIYMHHMCTVLLGGKKRISNYLEV